MKPPAAPLLQEPSLDIDQITGGNTNSQCLLGDDEQSSMKSMTFF
jgi:hypothetical protein